VCAAVQRERVRLDARDADRGDVVDRGAESVHARDARDPGRVRVDRAAVLQRDDLAAVAERVRQIQQARALGAEQPLVAARRVRVAAELLDVDRDAADRLRAIDEADAAGAARERAQLGDRHAQPGRRQHVRERHHAGARVDRLGEPRDDRRGIVLAGRDRDDVDRRAVALGDEVPADAAARVLLVGGEDAIARCERDALRDPVDALGRGRRDDELVQRAAEQRRRLAADILHLRLQRAVAERGRVALELVPHRDGAVDDRPRRRPERAGLQVRQAGVEQEVVGRREAAERAAGCRRRGRRSQLSCAPRRDAGERRRADRRADRSEERTPVVHAPTPL
jgi:hypothetical protein